MIKRDGKTYYTAHEVSKLLDVSKKTLFNWERKGLIPKIQRDWRRWRLYTADDVERIRLVIEQKQSGHEP
jgi:DNA-binding transcriptional MerR regulator